MTLELPVVERPLVSVIMVAYGGWDWPYRALEALAAGTDPVYEAVVVDNASWDRTADLLEEEVDGLTLVRNDRNVGFGPGVNQGAARSRGAYLCLLNADCLVRPGWLGPLLSRLESGPDIGAVIPRFLNPDGTVQEAGSVIDSQGWTHGLGAGADPDDPEHRFSRTVDYGSAACFLLRRSTFEALGGFDPAYVPAYCEDVDLCFRLAERGLRTIFEPRSTVVHAGAGSTGAALRVRLIEKNRRVLLRRWGERLVDRPPLTELDVRPHRLVALRDAQAADRLLFLSPRVPGRGDPLRDLLLRLAEGWPDVRLTVAAERGDDRDLEDLLDHGIEVLTGPVEPRLADRAFHYTAVVEGDGNPPDPFLQRTQPQAVRLTVEEMTEGDLAERMASLGAVRLA